jgi:hypothetical protein
MDELEFNGKIKGLKTLKEMIASKEVIPASQLEIHKAEEVAQEKAFEEAVKSEQFHRKTKICTGKVDGRVLWTRERFVE